MHHFLSATLDCPKDQAKIYEWAREEFTETDDGEREPTNPIKFPLDGVNVTVHGSRAKITLARPGKADLVLDRLVGAQIEQVRGNPKAWTLTGQSERLYLQRIDPADAGVTFTVRDHEAAVGSVSTGLA